MAKSNSLIILKNSSYAKGRKYVVDANDLMTNFKIILDSAGTSSIRDVIEATGQYFNPLVSDQLLNAITQLTLAANYFKDIGRTNEVILEPYTVGYGTPTQYVHKMVVKFRPSRPNTGPTTLAFNGTTGVSLLTDMYEELTSGVLLPTSDYTAEYDADRNAFILSSSLEDSGSVALQEIRRLVESAGLIYSSVLEQQLMQAVATYALQPSYVCFSDENNVRINNYVLKPYGVFAQMPKYTDGMVIRFRPNFSNTLSNPTIQVYGMERYPLVAANGDTIPTGSISTDFDVVVKYDSEKFYLVSNGLSSLKLQDGPVVTKISNDTSLGDGASDKLTTEFAVKTYVDAKVNATKNYAVASGKEDVDGKPDFLEKTDDTTVTIMAGENGKPSYIDMTSIDNAVASECKDPTTDIDEDGDEVTTTYDLANCFDGDNDTYYETKKQGADVEGIKNAEMEGQYIVMPEFVGATGLDTAVSKVRFLGNSSVSLPRSVFFQYSIDGGEHWQDVGTETYQQADADGEIKTYVKRDIYQVDFNSGEYSDVDVDIIPYVDATNPDLGVADTYDVRCYAYEFLGTTGWQLVNYQFCKESVEIKPLVLTYADGTSEVITEKIPLSTADLGELETSAVIIKHYGGQFELVDGSKYKEAFIEPTPANGVLWVKLGSAHLSTYYYNEVEEGVIQRQEDKFVKVGRISVNNRVISSCFPGAFNGEYSVSNLPLADNTSISHNIGSLNSAKMFITCIGSNGGYVDGDTVELVTQAIDANFSQMFSVSTTVNGTDITINPLNIGGVDYNITYSPNPHNHTATSTVTSSASTQPTYRVVTSGLETAVLRYNSIVLPNKNTGTLFAINPALWRLSVFCSRSF